MIVRILLIIGLVLGGPAAWADVTLSTSNDPRLDFNARLDALFRHEHESLRLIGATRLQNLVIRPVPRGARTAPPARIEYSRDWLDAQEVQGGGAQWRCLAEALYFEARGESVKGQFAVAEVILNRVKSARYPDTICEVVNEGTGRKYACQFTYTCDGHAEVIQEPSAWERVGKVAALMTSNIETNLTNGATHYHTTAVTPSWASAYRRTAAIGVHRFYRPN